MPAYRQRWPTARFRLIGRGIAVALSVPLGACGGAEISIVATLEGRPLADLEVIALPFDPQAVLDSLRAVAPTPPPDTRALEDSLRSVKEMPPPAEPMPGPDGGLRSRVGALADSLRRLDRMSDAYAQLYERFRSLYTTYVHELSRREAALRRDESPWLRLARRAQAAAESVRAWERVAYANFEAVAARRVAESGRPILSVVTDSTGYARLILPPGSWWVTARVPDPENVFFERYWRIPLETTGWLPIRLPLTDHTATMRWRH